MLIRLPYGHGLQLDDHSPNAKPDRLPVAIAAFEHFIGSPGRHDLSFGTMFADQQIGGSPDVAIGDHFELSLHSRVLRLGMRLGQRPSQRPTPEFYTGILGSPLGITPVCYLLLVPRLEDPTPFRQWVPWPGGIKRRSYSE